MLTWSEYFQNPDFLEVTRKFLIPSELKTFVLKYCGILENSDVLDVGCGTGFFCRYITEEFPDSKVTGIEYEEKFVEYANKVNKEKKLNINIIQGNALALPFDDNSFDAVTSHTFLTSVVDPLKAMKEMIRVCKKGGRVSSITTMSFAPSVFDGGYYRKDCVWAKPLFDLKNKMWGMFEKINPMSNYINDMPTSKIPHLFVESGLKDIIAYPIGKMFSLSNALLSYEDRIAYLEQMFSSEQQKIKVYMELEEARELFSRDDADRYLALLKEKIEYYKSKPEENEIWEWDGGANILISGKKEN